MKQGWEIKKLGEVCKLYQPKTISGEMLEDDGKFLVYGANGVIGRYSQYNHEDSEVLLTCRGATCGSINVSEPYSWINGNAMVVKPIQPDSIAQSFLKYYLTSVDWSEVITGAAQPQITRQSLSPLNIVIPPLPEQEKIVAELDCLSGIIEKKRQQLKELDALAQSIFYEMFGNPVTNEKGWEVAPLKDSVIEMFLGPFGSALKTECYVNKNDSYCMVYEQKHAIKKTLALDTHYIDKEKFESLMRFEVHSGDFIMSCRGTIGEIYRLPNDAPMGIIHPSLMKIRIREDKYNPVFFVRLLSIVIKNENTNGNCVQMAVTAKELGARKPILPPLPLQQEFASKIESIEKQKVLIKQSLGEVETLFNARMQEYFG